MTIQLEINLSNEGEKMKVLMLSYNFFGYEKEIIKELKLKYDVKHISLETNFLEVFYLYFLEIIFSITKRKEVYSKMINKKIERGINVDFKNIDILFILGFNEFDQNNFKFLSNNFNIQKKYLYLWDDVTRVKELFYIKNILIKYILLTKKIVKKMVLFIDQHFILKD